MTTRITLVAGLCSAIRPKLLTALPEERHPSVKITAWGLGHWHIPCPDNQVFPDADPWVKTHVATIDVDGAPTYARLVEYIACRAIAADNGDTGTMRLLSTPLDSRNMQWAAQWDTLPEPGEWRQKGCKHKPPKQGKVKGKQAAPAKRKTRKPAAQKGIFAGALVLRGRQQRRSR